MSISRRIRVSRKGKIDWPSQSISNIKMSEILCAGVKISEFYKNFDPKWRSCYSGPLIRSSPKWPIYPICCGPGSARCPSDRNGLQEWPAIRARAEEGIGIDRDLAGRRGVPVLVARLGRMGGSRSGDSIRRRFFCSIPAQPARKLRPTRSMRAGFSTSKTRVCLREHAIRKH